MYPDSSFFVFRPSSCAALSSPAAAVSAAAIAAVGSVKLQKRKTILSMLTLRTSRQSSENRMQVRDFVLWAVFAQKLKGYPPGLSHF